MSVSYISFLHFEINTNAIAIGERVKGGTFRPCIETIPTSTLKGTFKVHFGIDNIYAIGFFRDGTFLKDYFTYAPFDTILGTAKLPLSLEYLRPTNENKGVISDIYIVKNDKTKTLITSTPTELSIGALKSKGFGRCSLKFIDEIKPEIKIGYLKGRLLEEECNSFNINRVIKSCYGYLFYPTSEVDGIYKRALYEDSIIEGPEFLIKEEYKYDT